MDPDKDKKPIDSIAPDAQDINKLKADYEAAQKKLAEQGKQIAEWEPYLREADEVGAVLKENEELLKAVRQAYLKKKGYKMDDQQDKDKDKDKSNDVDDGKIKTIAERLDKTEQNQRATLIKNFERLKGIDSLDASAQKELKASMGLYLSDFGYTPDNVPLERLESVMDKAYKAVNADKAIQEGKWAGAAEAYTNKSGAFGSMNSRNINDDEEQKQMTAAQKKWIQRSGLDDKTVEKYTKLNEQGFIPRAESEAKKKKNS